MKLAASFLAIAFPHSVVARFLHEAHNLTVERARAVTRQKPWGVSDLLPWSSAKADGAVGEIWFERSSKAAEGSSLLLKLLFTSQPLSIQVHPDDSYAQSIGLPNGKTEAWYILSAAPGAKVALGLREEITPQQLRSFVESGKLPGAVLWRSVTTGDTISVPAGTIHAIGAGLVIAEIQQRSDATFRMFDYGRERELHIENAVAVADTTPAGASAGPKRLTDQRTVLVSGPYFVFESIDLTPNSIWTLDAIQETWMLVVKGSARAGTASVGMGDAMFVESDSLEIRAGELGLQILVAYADTAPAKALLQ
jgi:mannose-6-phosphate isomerase